MTARERINDPPAPLHPSRRRALARIAKVRSNSDRHLYAKCASSQLQPRANGNTPVASLHQGFLAIDRFEP